jgi:tetratricopeptide (TPR) repeat protein
MQPENWAYLHGLGAAHYYADQWEEAITYFTESTKFFGGEHTSNYLFLAMTYWQINEKTMAKNCYNKAIEWMENNRDQWFREFRGRTFGLYLEASQLIGIDIRDF